MGKKDALKNKTVLITGGTGTFGNAIVSKLLSMPGIRRVNVLSRDEYKQDQMMKKFNDSRLRFFLGDIRDPKRLHRAFSEVDIVVHAAALKQVPALEYNPNEAIKTNIIGTQNVIDAALDNNVERVIFISSDKAVQPVNLYGATKLCAERVTVSSNAYRGTMKKTLFSVVRYGNVIGSRGSIVEILKNKDKKDTLYLTDERMTRFWISIDDVVDITLDAITCLEGGEIFVPKMNSLKIADVFKAISPDSKVEVIGMRPGEKLHELLITEYEMPRTKDLGNMFAILPEFANWERKNIFANKPNFPPDVVYSSDDSHFLLGEKDAKRILGL